LTQAAPVAAPLSLVRRAAALLAPHYPEEGCGLILEDAQGGLHLHPCDNQAPDRRRHFSLDPLAILAAHREGLSLWGVYHSHCDQSADFSALDRQGARLYPRCGHLVVSLRQGQPVEAALWRWCPARGRFEATARHQL
jgi:proteasome lid subunit RPN8/RPN11